MTGFNITQLRLQNQHLASPVFTNPADIVQYMGAIQAQDYGAAAWAVAQRLKDTTHATIDQALSDGDIIRIHVMRPTWHFVSPQDVRWMLELTAPRVQAIAAFRHRQLKLDNNVFMQSEKALVKALSGNKQLMRAELAEALQQAGIATDEQRFIHIMMELELRLLICSGGRQGKQFTYALLDERVPKSKTLTRHEALAALAGRYFSSHGPATLQDYAWWSGLTVTDAKASLEMVKDKLNSQTVEGNTYWFADQPGIPSAKSNTVFLLPNYDEYTVSYKDRSAVIATSNINKADPRGTIFNNTIIINGQIVGTWKREFRKNTVILDITPFRKLSKANDVAIRSAAKRYTRFLGLKDFIIQV